MCTEGCSENCNSSGLCCLRHVQQRMLSKGLLFSCKNCQGIIEKWRSGGQIKEKTNRTVPLSVQVYREVRKNFVCTETRYFLACGGNGEGHVPDAPVQASIWEKMMD